MNSTHTETITVPIVQEAHEWAIKFAAEQSTPQKSRGVYLNTLAVYAVYTYLQWLQVDTDLDQGDSWHSGIRPLFDVADLVVPGVGKLECCPVPPGEASFKVPQGRLEERVGYVAVQFKDALNEVDLLGFTPAFNPLNIPAKVQIDQLRPIEDLFEYLDDIEQGIEILGEDDPVVEAVLERLETKSLSEIVAELYRIYQNEPKDEQVFALSQFLENESELIGSTRESSASESAETLQVAENLLEKLKGIWGERSFETVSDSPSPVFFVEASAAISSPAPEVIEKPKENKSQAPAVSLGKMLNNLRQSFQSLFEGDWLEPSMVLIPAYRGTRNEQDLEGSIRRARRIEFGLLGEATRSGAIRSGSAQAVALVIELTPESETEVGVSVQVYPGSNARHLPVGLQVIAIDESGATILEEQAESGADSIELEFGIEPRERFSVRLLLGDGTVTEHI